MKYEPIHSELYSKSTQKENEVNKNLPRIDIQSKKHISARTNSSTPAPEFKSEFYKPQKPRKSSIHSCRIPREEFCSPYELEETQSPCILCDFKKLSRYFQLDKKTLRKDLMKFQALD